ncbi:YczE/YyaS/YitT family protein [Enterococcus columbae]|uniref:Uncharacterized protein n=1 Tax=Enterococcus columbae DSM 7374 = ATCC 51263 TaxID=1121865 RepID=S1NFH1_9ENTE|nr:hypothetical protein [Enterococcus columbae]EOT38562.1 hypothetical protein OMW_02202 [Enterococcus columbae DSM 7374 = ATCC 51263]EOW87787.1 hypothetical protein I568_00073 [Enterococcus columbae DSM 7374 = ATCC 51263]
MKSLFLKSLCILPAVLICGVGVSLFVRANLGCDPVTMFEIALTNLFSISLGQAALGFEGLVFLIFFFFNRKLIHMGTFLFAFGIGPAIDFSEHFLQSTLGNPSGLFWQAFYLITGTLAICWSLAFYIPLNFGYQTSDILTLSLMEWAKLRYSLALIIVYAGLFLASLPFQAPFGIGSIIAVVSYGPIIDYLMQKVPFNAKTCYQSLAKYCKC